MASNGTGGLQFGRNAKELLLDLKRSDWLPQFNNELIRKVAEEINLLYKASHKVTLEPDWSTEDPSFATPLTLYHFAALRNKRCVLAYLRYRVERLIEERWQYGSSMLPERREKLGLEECRYVERYDEILTDYMRSTDMELGLDLEPPKNLHVEVRVIKDCGMTTLPESGDVNLEKDTNHFLRRCDVENLLRQGIVEQIS